MASGDRPVTIPTIMTSSVLGRATVVATESTQVTNDNDSLSSGESGGRFKRAVCRVLIALSFKSFRRRNETKRRRERSDCSEARFLAVTSVSVTDETPGGEPPDSESVIYETTDQTTQQLYHVSNDMLSTGVVIHGETPVVTATASSLLCTSAMPRRGRREAVYDPKALGRVSAPDGGDMSPTDSCDEADNCGLVMSSGDELPSQHDDVDCSGDESAAGRGRRRRHRQQPISLASLSSPISHSPSSISAIQLRRKRSSADLGTHYPGDLLSLVRPRLGRVGSASLPYSSTAGVTTVTSTSSSSSRRLAVSGPAGSKSGRRAPPPLLKRNTIGDFASTNAYHHGVAAALASVSGAAASGQAGSDQDKKLKRTFSLLKLKKSHRSSKDNLPELSEVLQNLKQSEFKDSYLTHYKEAHWMNVLAESNHSQVPDQIVDVTETERKRREAVWELFKSECVFLIDHLMALKHCFMEPMKKVQVEGHLMFTEPQDLFGNLDELCYVSYTFSRDFISLLLKDSRASTDFGRTDVLIKGLRRFCQLTRDGEVYHDYCLNYSKAMMYLERLRKNDDFCEFEKWCELDERCHRLQLNDLLISPMQHCTKVPLLLNNIRRYTEDPREQQLLTVSLQKLETSLQNLEAKMKWLKNFERVQELQQQIVWRPITELEPRAFIPEFLRSSLSRQPCERLLASPNRHLLHEGPVTLLEISKTVDMYLFLFDDILLITRIKKAPRKKSNTASCDPSSMYTPIRMQTDGALFIVHRQPIALDRLTVHDVRQDMTGVVADATECFCTDTIDPSCPIHQQQQQQQQPLLLQQSQQPLPSTSGSSSGVQQQFFAATTPTAITTVHQSEQYTRPYQPGMSGQSPVAVPAVSIGISQPTTSTSPPQQQPLASPDSDGGAPTDWCLPHFVDDCPGQRGSNLLFGCLSVANGAVLKNAFVIVQFNQFQQIIGVYTLQAPTDVCKMTWISRLHDAQERYHDAARSSRNDFQPRPPGSTRGSLDSTSALASPFTGEHGPVSGRGFIGGPVNINVERASVRSGSGGGGQGPVRRRPMLGSAGGTQHVSGPQQLISLSVPGFEDDGYYEATDDSQEGATGRRIRSSSSDAVVISGSTDGGCNCLASADYRRISDPICHSARCDFAAAAADSIVTRMENGGYNGGFSVNGGFDIHGSSTESRYRCDETRRLAANELSVHRDADGLYPDEGVHLPSQTQQNCIDDGQSNDGDDSATRRTELQRCRQTSLRVKRRSLLKSIHEKSQSIDTC